MLPAAEILVVAFRFIKRVGRAKSGATALEFTLIAPVFFLMIFAIIEGGAIYISEATLQYGTYDMGRMIRTGQIDLQQINSTGFRNKLCDKIAPFLACNANLQVDVRHFNEFSAVTFVNPLNNKQLDPAYSPQFDIGSACDVVLVRTFYKWKVNTPLVAPFLSNMTDDYRLVAAASAFRNEPYTNNVSGCS